MPRDYPSPYTSGGSTRHTIRFYISLLPPIWIDIPLGKKTTYKPTRIKKEKQPKYIRPKQPLGTMGNLHDNRIRTPATVDGIDILQIILILFTLCIFSSAWYAYISFHSNWWLILCVPLTIICIPCIIFWTKDWIWNIQRQRREIRGR